MFWSDTSFDLGSSQTYLNVRNHSDRTAHLKSGCVDFLRNALKATDLGSSQDGDTNKTYQPSDRYIQ